MNIHNSVGQPGSGYHVECKVCNKSIIISHLKTMQYEVKRKSEEKKQSGSSFVEITSLINLN